MIDEPGAYVLWASCKHPISVNIGKPGMLHMPGAGRIGWPGWAAS